LSNETKNSSLTNGGAGLPLVVVNPKSAGGATRENWAEMAADFRAHFGPFQVAFTKCAGDGTEIAKRAALAGRGFIIACGGDGTINEVANGILQSGADAELGVLPNGTGGDFRRTIGISNNEREAARALRTGETKLIDVGRVTFLNHRDEPETRYFLNVASFGLSASINERVKEKGLMKWLPLGDTVRGKTKFALSTLQELVGLDYRTVRVKIDAEEEKTLNTINFCVCNSRFFGGGMKIAPHAVINDGFFDVVNIGDIRTAKILLRGYTLYTGTHLELPEVKSRLARKIEVSAVGGEEVHIETDGELPGKLPATFEIVPNALRVRVPKRAGRLES
jgi:YegS/Rv2252/BmrU family lipid kinase